MEDSILVDFKETQEIAQRLVEWFEYHSIEREKAAAAIAMVLEAFRDAYGIEVKFYDGGEGIQ